MEGYPGNCLLCGNVAPLRLGVCPSCDRSVFERLFRSYAAGICGECGRPLLHDQVLCVHGKPTRYIESLAPYGGPVKSLIIRYKKIPTKALAPYVASLYRPSLERLRAICGRLAVVPVPGSRSSIKRRGWDQMKLVGGYMEKTGVAQVFPLVMRIGNIEQKSLKRERRITSAESSYVLDDRGMPAFRDRLRAIACLVVIDDVTTSGATMARCMDLLENTCKKPVVGLCLAMD